MYNYNGTSLIQCGHLAKAASFAGLKQASFAGQWISEVLWDPATSLIQPVLQVPSVAGIARFHCILICAFIYSVHENCICALYTCTCILMGLIETTLNTHILKSQVSPYYKHAQNNTQACTLVLFIWRWQDYFCKFMHAYILHTCIWC